MIGTILSLKYFGRKGWKDAIVFWLVYLVAGAILSSIVLGAAGAAFGIDAQNIDDMDEDEMQDYVNANTGNLGILGVLSTIISVGLFLALAHYWYKYAWFESLKLFAISYVIDIIIVIVLVMVLFGAVVAWGMPSGPTAFFLSNV